jgi:hypothetical protein
VDPSYSLVEPALQTAPTSTPRKQQDSEADLAEDDRVNRDLSLVSSQPLEYALVGVGLGPLGEDVRIDQIRGQGRSEGVRGLGFDLHEPVVLRAGTQPVHHPLIRRRHDPGQPILVRAYPIDLKLLARLDAVCAARSVNETAMRRLAPDPLLGQLAEGRLALLQSIQAHRSENLRRLGELDVPVVDDLDQVAPGIAEVEPAAG